MTRSYAITLNSARGLTASAPFGRLRVQASGLRLYAPLMPWVRAHDLARADIARIVLIRSFGGMVTLKIEDEAGRTGKFKVRLRLPTGKLRRELIASGYPVVAYDRWLSWRNPWQKKGWSAPPGRQEPASSSR
jgi:hypothetical protein